MKLVLNKAEDLVNLKGWVMGSPKEESGGLQIPVSRDGDNAILLITSPVKVEANEGTARVTAGIMIKVINLDKEENRR